MKYDTRKIMTRAWAIKRQDPRNDFGLCLRMAWEEAKEAKPTMRGTEKQLAWARDIQTKAVSALNYAISFEADKKDFVATCEKIKSAVESCAYAGDLIAVYGNITVGKNDAEVMRHICSIVKLTNKKVLSFDTPAQYALIGK